MMVAGADMFPVRVLVETVRSQHCLGCAHDGNPMVDTFAVVGGQTMLCQLVETVLSALGLPQLVQDSKGLIQINGWKPIAFETITDNPEELVVNLFREISTHITLKILAKRSSSEPNGQCLAELKQRLLKTAIEKQPQILTTANGQEVKEILQQVIQGDQQCSAWTSREQADAVNEWLEQMAAQQEDGGRKSPLCTTRFSPLSELPRLERWFRSDPNPSRQKLLSYMKILNSLPYRRANNKVTYQQICNWFVNQRRTAQRNGNGGCQGRNEQQQQASSSSAGGAKKPPMAVLPLNATGATGSNQPQPNTTSTNFTLLNSLATALAANGAGTGGGNMDSAQMQQKMATFLAGLGDAEAMLQQQRTTNMLMLDHNSHHNLLHQIPMAVGPPLDIRAKFEVEKEQQQPNDCAASSGQQEGGQRQSGGGQHSDCLQRMDGGSESPTGNDDLSEHSGTSGGPAEGTGDSVACSPDELFMDVTPHQNGVHQNELQDSVARPAEEQQQSDLMNNGAGASSSSLEAATGLSLAQLLQQQQQQPTGNGHQTPPPPSSTHASAMAAAAAAAAAFSSLMPAQTQLQLMNQLAMASQFHHQQQQGISPSTPQPSNNINPFATSNGAAIKSSPSSNSLSAVGRGGEENNVRTKHDSENNYNNSPGGNGGQNSQSRSRLMFDPLSELPILERWFEENPHPGWLQIEQYTDFLNSMTYRQNYPPISTHNVKIWFKNRRAKTKRLLGNNDSNPASNLASS